MRPILLRRRALVGAVLSTALITAGFAALAADASAGCSFPDPAGDSAVDGVPGTGDDDVDITAVGFSGANDALTAAAKVVALTAYGPANYPGDDFEFTFTTNKKVFLLGAYRDFNPTGDAIVTPYVYVNGTQVSAASLKPVYDVKASTFSISISYADLSKLAGAPAAGASLSALGLTAYVNFNGPERVADKAAPKEASTTYAVGASGCGGAAPAASPTAGSSASATPAATPSAPASATPSASASASPAASASSSASASASGSPSPGGAETPAAGCSTYTDPKGDSNAAIGPAGFGNDPDLDILSVTFKTTPEVLSAYIKVDKLAAKPSGQQFSGHKFDFGFTHNGKAIVLAASATGTGTGTVGGTANADLKPKAVFDIPSSQVIISIDRASIEKAGGAPLPDGTVITKTSARSTAVIATGGQSVADTAVGATPEQQTYTVGDNRCFPASASPGSGTGAARLTVSAPARVQSSDVEVVAATLKDSSGAPLAGKRVTAQVGSGAVVSGTTGSSGQVRLLPRVTDPAGRRVLSVRYAGDASGTGNAQVRLSITVVAEVSKIASTSTGAGSLRTFTITLTDDDSPRHPYVGAAVTFAYSGKTVKVSTNRYGRASVQAKPGARIDVRYPGRPGYVSPATARTIVR